MSPEWIHIPHGLLLRTEVAVKDDDLDLGIESDPVFEPITLDFGQDPPTSWERCRKLPDCVQVETAISTYLLNMPYQEFDRIYVQFLRGKQPVRFN